jgi:hypothetical protein
VYYRVVTPQCRHLADTEGRYRRYVDADHFLSAPKAKRCRYRGRYEQQTQPAAVLWTLIDTSLPSGPRTTSEGTHSERTSRPANTDYQSFLSAKYGRCEGLARSGAGAVGKGYEALRPNSPHPTHHIRWAASHPCHMCTARRGLYDETRCCEDTLLHCTASASERLRGHAYST